MTTMKERMLAAAKRVDYQEWLEMGEIDTILTELLTPTDEMIEAGALVLATQAADSGTYAIGRDREERIAMLIEVYRDRFQEAFAAAIQKALES